MSPPTVLTIGHSTRSIDEFIRLLAAHGVNRLIDIRTIARSRHNPQFSRDRLSAALRRAGIRYTHMAGLGGLRHPRPDSVNSGWRNAGFRGYADYMQTAPFRKKSRSMYRSRARRADRAHVRGGRSMAVSSLARRRRPARQRHRRERDYQRHSRSFALVDAVGRGNGTNHHLSRRDRVHRNRPLDSAPAGADPSPELLTSRWLHSMHTRKSIPSHRSASGQ